MSSSTPSPRRGNRALEVAAVIVLSVATIGSAWCAYQASQWSGEGARLSRAASDQRVEATRFFGLATQTLSYDTNTLGLYAAAVATGDEQLAKFYREALVRDAADPIVDRWTADVQAGRTPQRLLDDQAYLDDLLAPYNTTNDGAEALTNEATVAGDISNSYVLATVLLAVSLFFAGVTSSFRMRTARIVLLGAAGFALAFAAATIAELAVL